MKFINLVETLVKVSRPPWKSFVSPKHFWNVIQTLRKVAFGPRKPKAASRKQYQTDYAFILNEFCKSKALLKRHPNTLRSSFWIYEAKSSFEKAITNGQRIHQQDQAPSNKKKTETISTLQHYYKMKTLHIWASVFTKGTTHRLKIPVQSQKVISNNFKQIWWGKRPFWLFQVQHSWRTLSTTCIVFKQK